MKVMAAVVVSGCEDDGGSVVMAAGLAGEGGSAWRYGDDGGDDLDGIVAVRWLRQQRAAKVAAAATGGRNPTTAPDLLRAGDRLEVGRIWGGEKIGARVL
ncbi:hypothetical protein Tco_1047309 [Tanacetum coccineum]